MAYEQKIEVNLGHRPGLKSMRQLDPAAAAQARVENTGFSLEAVRGRRTSRPQDLAGRNGFNAEHLDDFNVQLPSPLGVLADDVVTVEGRSDGRLDYTNFTVIMRASRRMALFTAVNIEGQQSVSVERSNDKWSLDCRIPGEFQLGEDLYSGNRLDRGHLVRREDPNWGPDAEVANGDTFHFTNCAPQMDTFNQREWLGLENYILQNARAWKDRCSVFTGPIFGASDLPYRGALIPRSFWKVVAFLADDGKPSTTAYILTQDKELEGLEAAYGAYKTYQRSVASIQKMTNLDFHGLAAFDGFSNEEAATGLEISAELVTLGAIRV
ncbi:DNA/RNA non-specific endonuclease [Rhizobium laguerreae]|uniref:DNA/RNA non-specific endonuclease n=1 Tax=Rhizobium laguerreae TaxID=1076926 RepID=UPI001C91A5DB|nr:DNA/RNA non-specific endonuclease [Rhizobium laguerreae]MBY3235284.1 DNA/RNA non-specific endonuclease [Rhizobium laguerreae]